MTDQQRPGNLPLQQPRVQYQQGPPPGYGAPPGYGPPQPPPRKRHRVRNAILAIAGAIVLIIIIASVASSGKDDTAAGSSPGGAASSQAPSPAATTSSRAAPAAAQYTPEQQQAIEAAKQYLQMSSGFSRLGLIQQLDSSSGNGFPRSVAKFAVTHIKVNWTSRRPRLPRATCSRVDSATTAWCSSFTRPTATTSRTGRPSTALKLSDSDSRLPRWPTVGLMPGCPNASFRCHHLIPRELRRICYLRIRLLSCRNSTH